MIKRINYKKRMRGWIKIEFQRVDFNIIVNSSYFLVWIYILGGMVLKMKKFVIQWRKFESKRSSRNEVMNFLDFIFIFQVFFRIYLYMRVTREANVAQRWHVAEPRDLTWMPTWAHGYSGPTVGIGGILGSLGVTQRA